MRILTPIAVLLLLLAVQTSVSAAPPIYYVDAERGNDKNGGTSPDEAWRTLDRINGGSFKAGSQILLHAGQMFPGSLYLTPENVSGDPDQPVVLGSYGDGPATIASGSETALTIHNVGYIEVENLNLVGTLERESCRNGGFEGSHGVVLQNDAKENMFGLTLENMDITGYCIGVLGSAWDGAPGKLQNVRISNLSVHDNHAAGIMVMGDNPASKGYYTLENIQVDHCLVYNHPGVEPPKQPGANLSGSAIFVYEAAGALIDRNVAFDNGGQNDCIDGGKTGGGPAAIWSYGQNITIQHNEVFNQRTSPQCRWDGIAINGNGSNVLIQYNYTHDNDGLSILQDNRPGQSNNTIRYNISENDCLDSNNQGMIMVTGGGENLHIYNNTIVTSQKSVSVGPMVYVGPDNDHGSGGRMRNVSFRNNIFVSGNKGPLLMAYGTDRIESLRFENNVYYDPSGRYKIDWDGTIYNGLKEWAKQTGQETDGKQALWRTGDPGVCALYGGGTVYPNPLESLTAYRLAADSPLIDTGLDLALYEINIGNQDFFGNPPWTGAGPDVGAHEFQDGQGCK